MMQLASVCRRWAVVGACGLLGWNMPTALAQPPVRHAVGLAEEDLFPADFAAPPPVVPATYETPVGEPQTVQPVSHFAEPFAPPVAPYPRVPMDLAVPDVWEHPHEIKVTEVKVGPAFPVSGGVYADRLNTGWTAQVAGRALFDWPGERVVPFAELGGGYVGQYGEDGATSVVDGVLALDQNGQVLAPQFLPNSVAAELKELHRGFVHFALGTSFTTSMDQGADSSGLIYTARAGVRVGHVDAEFEQLPTTSAFGTIAALQAQNPGLNFDLESAINDTDILWGVLGSVGVRSPWRSIWYHDRCLGDMSWGADAEYVYDWFDLGTFDDGTNGLGNLNLLFTWTVRR